MRLFVLLLLAASADALACTGVEVTVTNDRDEAIQGLRISDVGLASWSENLLSAELAPGDSATVCVDGPSDYDVEIELSTTTVDYPSSTFIDAGKLVFI